MSQYSIYVSISDACQYQLMIWGNLITFDNGDSATRIPSSGSDGGLEETGCENIAGTYRETHPEDSDTAIVEMEQHGCSGVGVYDIEFSVRGNIVRTVEGLHGTFENGIIRWDNGFVYTPISESEASDLSDPPVTTHSDDGQSNNFQWMTLFQLMNSWSHAICIVQH